MPVVATNDDGRLEVFMVGQDRRLYHKWEVQLPDSSYVWNNEWETFGVDWPSGTFREVVLATNADRSLEIFALGIYGQIYENRQVQPNDGWSNFSQFVDKPAGSVPVVARNFDGRLEVFILGGLADRAGKLYHKWQTYEPVATWNDKWEELGGPWGSLPVLATSGYRLEVFMVGQDRQLYHRWQVGDPYKQMEVWNDKWETLGGDWPSIPVVANNGGDGDGGDYAFGRLEVFMVGQDRQLYHRWQVQPNDGWNDKWETLGGDWPGIPVVAIYVGRLQVFMVGHDRQLYHRWQEPTNIIGWNAKWETLGGDWPSIPVVATNVYGRLELFMVGQDRQLYHMRPSVDQTWYSLGGDWPSIR